MPEPATPQRDLWHDLQPLLDREVSRLPAKYRIPLVLCDLEGRPRQEVARQLGWPEGTLSGRLARARQALARRLTQRGVTVTGAVLAPALADTTASASLPPAVAASTIRAAMMDAAGQAAAGAVSAPVAALTEGVLNDMLFTKLTSAAAVLLAVGLLALGGGLLSIPTAAGQLDGKPANGTSARTPRTDKEKLQGVWKVVSYGSGDKPSKGEEILFLVNGNRACWQTKEGGHEGGLYLDPSARPKTYDLATSERTIEGIYDLDGDTLRLCYDLAEEAPRPHHFAAQPGSGQVLLVLKRQKEFGTDLSSRRPDGSKVLFPSLVEQAKNGPPPPPPSNLDTPPPPTEGQKMSGLSEQVKNLERRVAALEAKLNRTADAGKKQPLRVNRIIIVGNEKTPDRVIRDRLELFPGQAFDAQSLRAAEKRLSQFNATVRALEDDGDSVYRDIQVTVKEK
jgi:RNA polymerase sigma-70 factor (ECF subfamily)